MSKKILYSPGYGAGWASWNSGPVGKFMAEYEPIINAIENDEPISELIVQMQKEIFEKFGEEYVCVLGADQLKVTTVHDQYRINDYDGFESVEERSGVDWW